MIIKVGLNFNTNCRIEIVRYVMIVVAGAADIQSKDTPKPDAPKIVIHKNDTPNKFWASVEPYCSPISQDDLTYLEELIKTREKERNSDLMKIPPLGKHYCARWADEDLGDEVKRRNEPTERLGLV